MERLLLFLLFLLVASPCLAQVLPVVSNEADLSANHVKTLSVHYKHPLRDTPDLILQQNFNERGLLTKKYILSLWNEVTYTHTTSYVYNTQGWLVEEYSEEKIHPLFPRDSEYLEDFGNKPLHQTTLFEHNAAGQLIKITIYVFNTAQLDKNNAPAQTVTYTWDGSLLMQEKSASPEDAFRHTYQIDYIYDENGKIISKRNSIDKDLSIIRTNSYLYDSLGRVDEEVVSDPSMPHNSARLKYTYDDLKRVTGKYKLDEMTTEFELVATYTYDKQGNIINGDRQVEFAYYENGLVKTEQWTDENSGEVFHFSTTYEYF